jgi:hypothetical protein
MTADDDLTIHNEKPTPQSDRQVAELSDDVRRWEWEGGAVAASAPDEAKTRYRTEPDSCEPGDSREQGGTHGTAREAAATEVDGTQVEISLAERTDALILMATLIPFNSFLVQHTPNRWVVHARAPGGRDESLDDLLGTIERWASRRGLRELRCSLGGRVVDLSTRRLSS